MAKFPYTTSGTTTTNADGSVTLVWTLKTASGVTVHTDTVTFPQGTPAAWVFETLTGTAKSYILSDVANADLPATFNFSIAVTDLM